MEHDRRWPAVVSSDSVRSYAAKMNEMSEAEGRRADSKQNASSSKQQRQHSTHSHMRTQVRCSKDN